MHDHRLVREQIGTLRDGMRRRLKLDELAPVIDRAEELDRERRAVSQAVEERKAARNAMSQEVARRKKSGDGTEELLVQGRALGEEIARLERELASAEAELDSILLEIPNITLADVPDGGEEHNTVV